jgi:hypothetical protein
LYHARPAPAAAASGIVVESRFVCAVAFHRLRRLGAGLVICAYLGGCSLPCGAATLAPKPDAAGHAAHAEHHGPSDSDAIVLQAPCDCGCQRQPGASGLLSSPGPALLPAPWRLSSPCLETRLGAVRAGALGERGVALDHVPIFQLL